ncbi:hypothetical protein EV702DRAFT_945406, partial [Suillus placidus]
RRFTMSGLAALHGSNFAQGFSNNECQAAARALLRHDVQIDGTHYQTKTFDGLHPSYIAFQPVQQPESERTLSQKELCEAALQDVFDAITMQDRLDGGISLLIQRAGSDAISPEKIPLDLYVTPREMHEAPQQIGGDVAVLLFWATKNHQDRVSDAHSAIHEIINSGLRKITGDPRVNMQWTHYFRNIIRRYQVMIVGWPNNIPFVNLSKVSSALPELER